MTGLPDDRPDQSGRPNENERPIHGDWIEAEVVATPVSLGAPFKQVPMTPALASPATASHVGPHGYVGPSEPEVPLAAPEPGSLASFFLDGERRLRTAWRFLLFFFALVVVELGAAIATLIALAIWFGVANLAAGPATDAQAFSNWLNKSPLLMVGIGGMVSAPLSLGVCWVFRRFVDRRSLAQSGFVWPKSFVWGGSVGTLIGVVLISLSAVVVHLMGGLQWQGFGGWIMPLALIVPLIGAAFHEEVLVRGYLLQNLVEIRRPWFGIFFTSLVFWLAHGLNPSA